MNITEIQDLIKFVSKSGVTEVEIEKKDFKITIKAESKKVEQQYIVQAPTAMPAIQAAPAIAPVAAPAPAASPAAPAAEKPAND